MQSAMVGSQGAKWKSGGLWMGGCTLECKRSRSRHDGPCQCLLCCALHDAPCNSMAVRVPGIERCTRWMGWLWPQTPTDQSKTYEVKLSTCYLDRPQPPSIPRQWIAGGNANSFLEPNSSSALQLECTQDKTQQQHVGVDCIPLYMSWNENYNW